MNTLHNLSASGWVLLASTFVVALSFIARTMARSWKGNEWHCVVLGVQIAWLLYLVTP